MSYFMLRLRNCQIVTANITIAVSRFPEAKFGSAVNRSVSPRIWTAGKQSPRSEISVEERRLGGANLTGSRRSWWSSDPVEAERINWNCSSGRNRQRPGEIAGRARGISQIDTLSSGLSMKRQSVREVRFLGVRARPNINDRWPPTSVYG